MARPVVKHTIAGIGISYSLTLIQNPCNESNHRELLFELLLIPPARPNNKNDDVVGIRNRGVCGVCLAVKQYRIRPLQHHGSGVCIRCKQP